tara:strand:- start:43287 stop:48545 length:5259 start_codon:yes stop_codon:yes gene_type:complete
MILGPKITYPNTSLFKIFEECAVVNEKSLALQFNNETITYHNLLQKSNKMANYLWKEGIRPGTIVAISLERTPELIITLLAILKCGGIYLPLDPKFPQSRLEFMLNDSEAKFLITSKKLSEYLPKFTKTILIQDALSSFDKEIKDIQNITVEQESVAYMLYTSGSTGKPKGVTVTHKNLVNFLFSMAIEPGIKETDKLLSITTISFDIAGLELFLPLIKGAKLVLADDDTARDGKLLLDLLKKEDITILQATPTTWQMLLDIGWTQPLPLKALCGGEAMPLNLAHQLIDKCDELWNMYGPTETTIWSSVKQIKADDKLITVGKPIANTQIYLLNEKRELVKPGEIGEIVIGGDGVSQGYWKRPELTAEKFISNSFSKQPKDILYRTGDLGKILPNNDIQCLGRIDQQVKIRGHRIELEEIESVINDLAGIKQSVVIASNHLGNGTRLVAYIKAEAKFQDINAIRNKLTEVLPDILCPSYFVFLDEFPVTPNGKIDKKNLPIPEYKRPDSWSPIKKPRTNLEKQIVNIWSEQLQIPKKNIGVEDNFFDLGGTSILAQKLTVLIKNHLSIDISVSKIYTHPTIIELIESVNISSNKEDVFTLESSQEENSSKDIAIIGMAGRFPGANTIEELWNILRDGKETITFFSKEELDISIPDYLRNDPLYVTARGLLPSAKTFDADFFGLNPKLAQAMDPQQRIFLEICWEALEQAGHLPKHFKGSIGVYAGCEINTYYENNVYLNNELQDQVGGLNIYTVNGKDFIAPRVAYHLNLKGPAVSVHSACSTSLLAITEAATAIRTGQCDVALAGGSSVTAPIYSGHPYDEGFIKSPNGSTRPFDASGKGTVFSDGAGVVLLKSLEAAKRDGDTIYGIIKGVGVNNDGGDKGSFMAPNSKGQAGAITKALNDAQVLPSTISYLEAHGTATLVGDPIEVEGLKIAYGKQERNGYCALGSIKSNFGHTTAAAGVAGLIKTILAMRNKQIPPLVGFTKPNPNIDFENSPFYLTNKVLDWVVDGPRRAGISSFGIGSTNVHVIVEEYEMEPKPTTVGRPSQILTWSAKSENSLSGYQSTLGNFIQKSPNTSLADIAYSLSATRDEFSHRTFSIADTSKEAAENLTSLKPINTKSSILKVEPTEMGFLFPGQGSQYLQMGKTLYDNEKVYSNAIDECAELLKDDLKLDIRNVIFPATDSDEAEAKLKNTFYTQPALFITEYALSKLWMSWGIKPTLLCGHSVGEFVAAHLAGVFSLKDALHVIATRSRLVSELPGGSMLSVRLPEDELKKILPKTLSIAAINSKHLCVVSGKDADIEDFSKIMESKDVPNRILFTSHAFHSSMMDPMMESFEETLKKVTLNIPRLPIVSTVTGTWLTDDEATSVMYWVNHVKNTVRFADAMDTVLALDDFILLEVGPGKSLTSLAQQQAAGKIIPAFSSFTFSKERESNEYTSVLNALGEMWIRGMNPDWKSFYKEQQRQKIDLPSYVFDRKPCWVEAIVYNGATGVSYCDSNSAPKLKVVNPSKDLETVETVNEVINEGDRRNSLLEKISEIINLSCGITLEPNIYSNTFLELGLDSLVLAQLSVKLKKEFNLPITFRQLNEDLETPNLLVDYFDQNLPKEDVLESKENHKVIKKDTTALNSNSNTVGVMSSNGQQQTTMEQISNQLEILSKQIEALQNAQLNNNSDESLKDKPINLKNAKKINISKTNVIRVQQKDISKKDKELTVTSNKPPMPGARLGRDEKGNPAWYIKDSNKEGKYIKINF